MFGSSGTVLLQLFVVNLVSARVTRDVSDWDDYGSPPRRSLDDRKLFRVDTSTFGYDDTSSWGDTYPSCNGPYQSPINIDVSRLEYRLIKRPLKWHNMEKIPSRARLETSDIVLELLPEWKNRRDIPYLNGGPLNESYYFYNFHFHWDSNSDSGSEHAVNGKRFPMEIHAVYTSNPEGIITRSDRILVTAFMVLVTDAHNRDFEPIIAAASGRPAGRGIPIHPYPLKQFGLSFCADYVIYSGSLTTPPCTQGVTWTISSQPIKISRRQYQQLKRSRGTDTARSRSNNRPLQPLNGRNVFYVVAPSCQANARTFLSHRGV